MTINKRIFSIDLLRGLIIVIMALDHTRDYVNASALAFNPEDLTRTTHALFFTRWITHFCAPVFAFTAGLGVYFRLQRVGSKPEMTRFLITRGLWLIFLEFTAVRFAMFFTWDYNPTFFLVFWMLGAGMIALAALIHLPFRWLVTVTVSAIVLHNLADTITPAQFGAYSWIWTVLHQVGPIWTDPLVIVAYPLIPWIFVMAAGFCVGSVFRLPEEKRRKVLIFSGLALTVAFVVLRATNLYGDPRPWTPQPRDGFTFLSFLSATKNPPSLVFLLMTLGPAITLLGLIDRIKPSLHNALLVFGRTPQFFFVMHLLVIHLFAVAMGYARYGAQDFLWKPSPIVGGATVYPDGYGWSLPTAYLVWITVDVLMYPMCRWLADFKARRREWWVSYL